MDRATAGAVEFDLNSLVTDIAATCVLKMPLNPNHASIHPLVTVTSNYGIYNAPFTIRPMVHYKVKQLCSHSQLYKSGRTEVSRVSSLHDAVDRRCSSSVDSLFQGCGEMTEKALLPIRRHVRGTLRSPRRDAS